MRTLLVATSLLLASIALAPGAAAEPDIRPAECPGVATAHPYSDLVDVTLRSWGCQLRVTVLGGVDCPAPLDGSTSASPGNTVVTAHCLPGPLATSAAPCSLVPGSTVSDDCSTVSIRLYECVWGGYWHYHATKPVTVREYHCGPPTA